MDKPRILPNEHIDEYLDYYLTEIKEPPGFAIMIDGAWGSGKSFFVREILTTKYKDKYLFVSLYGITKYSEIESAFFEQLHPFLASKGAKMGTAILKGLVKTALKVDFDGDKKEDLTISSQLPDIELGKLFESSNAKFLVFDDLERCSMKINDVLGYINNFVENKGYRAIIIANESEIKKNYELDDNIQKYDLIKEKLIGRSFKIKPNFSDSYDHFLNTIQVDKFKQYLESEKSTVNQIFKDSGFENIRIIKHLFFDLNRLFNFIPEFAIGHKVFDSIFRYFLCIYIEFKKGSFGLDKIVEVVQSQNWLTLVDSHVPSNFKVKYTVLRSDPLPFSGEEIHNFFSTGFINSSEFGMFLKTTPYFFSAQTEDWKRLWYFHELEDSDFLEITQRVHECLQNSQIEDPFVILQIVGIFTMFSIHVPRFQFKDTYLEDAKNNATDLLSRKTFEIQNDMWLESGYAGLGYQCSGTDPFKEFSGWLFSEIERTYLLSFKEKAKNLFEVLDSSIEDFCSKICILEGKSSEYYNIPLLSESYAAPLYDAFKKANRINMRLIISSLEKRYDNKYVVEKLKSEKSFLETFLKELRTGLDLENKPVTSVQLANIYIPSLEKILENWRK